MPSRNIEVNVNGRYYCHHEAGHSAESVVISVYGPLTPITTVGVSMSAKNFEARIINYNGTEMANIESPELVWEGNELVYKAREDRQFKKFSGPMSVSRRRAGLRSARSRLNRRRA